MSSTEPETKPAVDATETVAQPAPKPGVFLPWLGVVVILVVLFGVHFALLDPLSEAIQQVDVLKQLTISVMPPGLSEAAGEFLSWFLSLSIQTPYGPLASILGVGLFAYMVILRFSASFFGALFSHLVLFLTGGTKGGWRVTFRVFGLNRFWVELVTLVFILALVYSPVALAWKLAGLLVGLLSIRLVGMSALLAQIVRSQDIGVVRTLLVAAPVFCVFTVLSMILSLISWLWVGLWCVAKVG